MTTPRKMLLDLATLLESLPEERFDYSRWVGAGWKGESLHECGTTACALGWATTLPEWQERGLRLDLAWGGIPVIRSLIGSSAGGEALGISCSDAYFLFSPHEEHPDFDWQSPPGDASARDVAAHIRRYVAARFPEAA